MDIFKKGLKKVAICGKKNVGKNTLSHIIGRAVCFDGTYELMAFADNIKEMIMLMFPMADRECLFGSSELRERVIPNALDQNGQPLTYRQALIDIGTLGRKYNPNIWVNAFNNNIKQINEEIVSTELIICSDLRFLEEFDYLKKHDFLIIKLIRNTGLYSTNITETTQDAIKNEQFDFILDNNGTIQDLETQAQKIVTLLREKP